MMYFKSLLFDPSLSQSILDAATPGEAKALGRRIRNFDKEKWNDVADDIVERGNYWKFNPKSTCDTGQEDRKVYFDYLRETKGKILVECNPDDRIWGIGYSIADAMDHVNNWGSNR